MLEPGSPTLSLGAYDRAEGKDIYVKRSHDKALGKNARYHLSLWHVGGMLYFLREPIFLLLFQIDGGSWLYQRDGAQNPVATFEKGKGRRVQVDQFEEANP